MTKILPGDTYGQLTVLQQITSGKNPRYRCVCSCGTERTIWGSGLCSKVEGTKSCGCLQLASAQRPIGQAAYKVLYARCKANAKIRKIVFDITLDSYIKLAKKDCSYCGEKPTSYNPYLDIKGNPRQGRTQRSAERAWVYANGVDRIDSLEGYTPTNCVTCCSQCNYSKLDYTVEEYLEHCHNVVRYQNSIKKAA